MGKIVIDKGILKEYNSLLVVLENCDAYEIDIEDILDVYCVAELIGKKNGEYRTSDGFIKISARASQTVEFSVSRNDAIGTEWDHRFKERLEMLNGAADMISFSLRKKEKRDLDIYVPYDPLENIMHGSEIELSNCPSFEVDGEGNMIIAFGERSKQPRRKDNNYSELIAGWKEAFGNYEPQILTVRAKRLTTFGEEQQNFLFWFKISDKNSTKDVAELVFMDCKGIAIEMFFPKKETCEIVMSKMIDGRIYVGFDGLGIDFICSSVIEYDFYCNHDK